MFSLTEENIRQKKGETNSQGKFNHFCGPCHGLNGNGEGQFAAAGVTPAPTNLSNSGYMVTLSDTDISNVITGGSISVGKSNLCPPWGNTFDKEWVSQMTQYVRTLSLDMSLDENSSSAVVEENSLDAGSVQENGISYLE